MVLMHRAGSDAFEGLLLVPVSGLQIGRWFSLLLDRPEVRTCELHWQGVTNNGRT